MSGIINSDPLKPTVREAAIALIRALDRADIVGQLDANSRVHLGQLMEAAALEERTIVAKLPNHAWAREGIAKVIAQAPPNEVTAVHFRAIVEAAQEGLDANRSFAVRWAADQRAIKRWQAGDELPHCGELRPLLGDVLEFLRRMDDVDANALGDRLSDELEATKPGNRQLTWPDHADLVVWLLGRLVDWERIQELRGEEGDSVSILCTNPDADEHHPEFAIECSGFWTGFADRRFAGRTMSEAIELAWIAKRDAQVAGYPEMGIEATLPPAVSGARFRRVMLALKRGMAGAPLDVEAIANDQLDALELLGECAALFREYEAHHLAKLGPRQAIVDADVSPQSVGASQAAIADIRAKARRNAAMADKIEAYLAPADHPEIPDLIASPTGADALAYGLSAIAGKIEPAGPTVVEDKAIKAGHAVRFDFEGQRYEGVAEEDGKATLAHTGPVPGVYSPDQLDPIGGKNTADYDRRQLQQRINDALSSYDPTADDGELGAVVAEHAPGWEWQRLDQIGQPPSIILTRYAPGEPL